MRVLAIGSDHAGVSLTGLSQKRSVHAEGITDHEEKIEAAGEGLPAPKSRLMP